MRCLPVRNQLAPSRPRYPAQNAHLKAGRWLLLPWQAVPDGGNRCRRRSFPNGWQLSPRLLPPAQGRRQADLQSDPAPETSSSPDPLLYEPWLPTRLSFLPGGQLRRNEMTAVWSFLILLSARDVFLVTISYPQPCW